MNYKLLAIDMDGTLLTKDKKITKRTIDDIKLVAAAGILPVISTGRALQGVEMYSELRSLYGGTLRLPSGQSSGLSADSPAASKKCRKASGTFEPPVGGSAASAPVILLNGAHIMTLPDRKTQFHCGLENETVEKVLTAGQNYGTTMCIWSCGNLYGNVINDNMHRYERLSGTEAIHVPQSCDLLGQGITKVLWYDEPAKIDLIEKEMRNMLGDSCAVCRTAPEFLEFFDPKVSKGSALQIIADMYGINREEVIAIGDGLNDVEMLSYAGLGIAMGNAEEEVQKQADYVTKPNYEEGVAEAIEKFLIEPLGLA